MPGSASALVPAMVVVATLLDVVVVNAVFVGHPPYTLLVAFAALFVVTYAALAGAYRYATRRGRAVPP
ncbi:hypothetical protein [Halocalculus aciditolerans]|uniref:Uncharacterized protein n=1 Tax=Halocalculus aciditolerans TaxID=1383812 RepID=A0A830FFZ3_9EURY|nr:hypothetical protein [Halocalculus aciditolerans]GGL70766.1 hypothetical protein GCM10009039_31040 [Halocalculus aciditolerans]